MRTQTLKRMERAFTLIEILMVVMILGVLAAITVPQFAGAATQAASSSLGKQLHTIRNQIELHNMQWPDRTFDPIADAIGPWGQLVTGDGVGGYDGNYLQTLPKNPLMNRDATFGAPGVAGWIWADPLGYGLNVYASAPAGVTECCGGYFDSDGDGNPD